jgi:hypothetical protein
VRRSVYDGWVLEVPTDLPGHELVSEGLADLRGGRESESALLVAMAAPRLRRLGFEVPAYRGEMPSHRLYEVISADTHQGLIVATTRLIERSGQKMLPLVELPDGTMVRDESARLAERIRAGELGERPAA